MSALHSSPTVVPTSSPQSQSSCQRLRRTTCLSNPGTIFEVERMGMGSESVPNVLLVLHLSHVTRCRRRRRRRRRRREEDRGDRHRHRPPSRASDVALDCSSWFLVVRVRPSFQFETMFSLFATVRSGTDRDRRCRMTDLSQSLKSSDMEFG